MLIVIDIETTGLDPKIACIWNVGAVAVRNGEIIEQFESLVQPFPDKFTPEHRGIVTKVSGMGPDGFTKLWDAPKPSTVARRLQTWWTGLAVQHSEVPMFTAFNAAFDSKFLCLSPWNIVEPLWTDCVMLRAGDAMDVRPGRDGKKYISLHKSCLHYGIEQEQAHDGLDDARCAALIAIQLGMG